MVVPGTTRPRRAEGILRQAVANEWSEWQSVRAIHEQCAVSLLRAHRLAHGWTLQQVTELIRETMAANGASRSISHQRVSQWENDVDRPSAPYLDALCRVYQTRPDRLGFGRDYSPGRACSSRAASAQREPSYQTPLPVALPVVLCSITRIHLLASGVDELRRNRTHQTASYIRGE